MSQSEEDIRKALFKKRIKVIVKYDPDTLKFKIRDDMPDLDSEPFLYEMNYKDVEDRLEGNPADNFAFYANKAIEIEKRHKSG